MQLYLIGDSSIDYVLKTQALISHRMSFYDKLSSYECRYILLVTHPMTQRVSYPFLLRLYSITRRYASNTASVASNGTSTDTSFATFRAFDGENGIFTSLSATASPLVSPIYAISSRRMLSALPSSFRP